jgi:hypothetical protein
VGEELADNSNLTKMPGAKFDTIATHIFVTLVMFNLVLLFKSRCGGKLSDASVARIREAVLKLEQRVVVYAGECFAVFSIKEFAEILGKPPG